MCDHHVTGKEPQPRVASKTPEQISGGVGIQTLKETVEAARAQPHPTSAM